MIGAAGATVLVIINIVFAGALGVFTGGLTCLVLRQRWNFRAAFQDALLAATVALIAAYLFAELAAARGVWASVEVPVLALAAASVVLRRLLGLAVRIAR